jgi:hypothetical protein
VNAIDELASYQFEEFSPLPADASEELIAEREQDEHDSAESREYHARLLSAKRNAAAAEGVFIAILHDLQHGTKLLWDAMQLSSGLDSNLRVFRYFFVFYLFISYLFIYLFIY